MTATTTHQLDHGTVYQITEDDGDKDNIYCERSYCTPDSRYFVFQRSLGPGGDYDWKYHAEFVACEFGTWKTHSLGTGITHPDVSPRGNLYHVRSTGYGNNELVRVEIATGQSRVIPVTGGVKPLTGMSVCPNDRYLAYGIHISDDPLMFGIELVDMQTGDKRILYRHAQICNPHAQIEPGRGDCILVQRNIGCRYDPDAKPNPWHYGSGATLFVLGIEDGSISPLQIGPPYTAQCSGHQQWMGTSRQVMATLLPTQWTVGAEDTLMAVGLDGPGRLVSRDFWGHVNVSPCGRYYCCDNGLTGDLYVGSTTTGRHALLCPNVPREQTFINGDGPVDAHAYLSPDLKWAVFTTFVSGVPQIAVASIPSSLLKSITIQQGAES